MTIDDPRASARFEPTKNCRGGYCSRSSGISERKGSIAILPDKKSKHAINVQFMTKVQAQEVQESKSPRSPSVHQVSIFTSFGQI
jgi:hypothetical protein